MKVLDFDPHNSNTFEIVEFSIDKFLEDVTIFTKVNINRDCLCLVVPKNREEFITFGIYHDDEVFNFSFEYFDNLLSSHTLLRKSFDHNDYLILEKPYDWMKSFAGRFTQNTLLDCKHYKDIFNLVDFDMIDSDQCKRGNCFFHCSECFIDYPFIKGRCFRHYSCGNLSILWKTHNNLSLTFTREIYDKIAFWINSPFV